MNWFSKEIVKRHIIKDWLYDWVSYAAACTDLLWMSNPCQSFMHMKMKETGGRRGVPEIMANRCLWSYQNHERGWLYIWPVP